MKTFAQILFSNRPIAAFWLALAFSPGATAFDSGSTGADGPFNPTVDTVVPLPDDGVFNYESINIPAGVTVRFERNTTNTPIRLLVAGDAQIDGVIDISGQESPATGPAGDGVLADDGLAGIGGPGGFDGGRGGEPGDSAFEGAQGLGPGGGFPALWQVNSGGNLAGCAGGGAGFGAAGRNGRLSENPFFCSSTTQEAPGGEAYGNDRLLPLIGGSGGGGGAGGGAFAGSGGGGGGGALLIAATGTLTVNGEILANGADSGEFGGAAPGGGGGGGAGGGIRLVATTIAGDGPIEARGGRGWTNTNNPSSDNGWGAVGRIRLEAENITRVAATNPPFTFDEPGPVFLSGMPSLRIIRVAGIDAPAAPTGSADIVLPVDEPNPVEVVVAASNVPLGNTVTVTMTPVRGNAVSELTDALDGTLADSTATTAIDIPEGPNTLQASVSFTVPESQARAFTALTGGEAVREIRLAAGLRGASRTVLVTESGREAAWNGASR